MVLIGSIPCRYPLFSESDITHGNDFERIPYVIYYGTYGINAWWSKSDQRFGEDKQVADANAT